MADAKREFTEAEIEEAIFKMLRAGHLITKERRAETGANLGFGPEEWEQRIKAYEAANIHAVSGTPETDDDEVIVREWPADPAPEAFAGLVGDFVTAWSPHTEACSAALAMQFLAALGSAVGRGPRFIVGGDDHFLNINVLLVGNTSLGRKGQSWGCVKHNFDKVLLDMKIPLIVKRGLSTGEGLIFAVRDPRHEPNKKGVIVLVDPGVDDKRLLVFESEFASVLRRMSREGSSLSEVLRQAWDSGDLGTMTRNAALTATGAHVAGIYHVTKSDLDEFLTDVSLGNGLINRFILVATRRVRSLPNPGRPPAEVVGKLASCIAKIIEVGSRLEELKRTPEAEELWASVYEELSQPRVGRRHNAAVSRAAAQVLRLQLIYAVQDLERVPVGPGPVKVAYIEPRHILSALAMWRHAEDTSKYVFGTSTGDNLADFVVAQLKKAGGGLSQKELSVMTRGRRDVKAGGLSWALGLLLSDGLVHRDGGVKRGVATRWYVGS